MPFKIDLVSAALALVTWTGFILALWLAWRLIEREVRTWRGKK